MKDTEANNNQVKKSGFFFGCAIIFISPILCLTSAISLAQNKKTDSLLTILKTAKEDTNKVNTLNLLSGEMQLTGDYEKGISYANEAKQIAERISLPSGAKGWAKGTADANHNLGNINYRQSNYSNALKHYFVALKIREEIKDKNGMAKSLGNIGNIYYSQGDYPKTLNYYFSALKMDEELGNKNGIARHFGNIGTVYYEQGDYPKALDYYFSRLKLDEESGNKNNMAINLGNIGNVYCNQGVASSESSVKAGLFAKALDYYFRALKIGEELGDKNRIAIQLGNIGVIYKEQAEILRSSDKIGSDSLYKKALDYYLRALKIAEELGDKKTVAINLGSIGFLYTSTGKFNKAEEYLNKALTISTEINVLNVIKDHEQYLSYLYDTTGRYKLSLIHYKKYITARDTIFSEENKKKNIRTEMNYDFEKKTAAAQAEQKIKDTQATADKKQQNIILYSVMGVLVLVLVFAFFIFRNLRVTQKQKYIIEQQKETVETQKKIVEEKQKEILDSIYYARRIQQSLLPKEQYINKKLSKIQSKKKA